MHVNTEDMMDFAVDILSNRAKFVVINFGTTDFTILYMQKERLFFFN
jgi:hypothetical protein